MDANHPDPGRDVDPELADAVQHLEQCCRHTADAVAAQARFEAAHPGPHAGGTMENLDASYQHVEDVLAPACAAERAAGRALATLLRARGLRACTVNGRLYLDVAGADDEIVGVPLDQVAGL